MDALFVSGIHHASFALSGIGLTQPFAFGIIALASGLAIGTNSLISRSIGAKDKETADRAAEHGIVITLMTAILVSLPLILIDRPMFRLMGAGKAIEQTVSYSSVIFGGSIFVFLSIIGAGILRAEGDTKRAMYAMASGSFLNILLDPVFIYGFKLGVSGAAWATIISRAISTFPIFYWIFIKKDTFVTLKFRRFKFKKYIFFETFKVGLPASISQLSMAAGTLFFNLLIIHIAGPAGIAIFTTGRRIDSIAILPDLGIASAVISVVGAWWGARDRAKIEQTMKFGWEAGMILGIIISILLYAFAPYLTMLFTTDPSMKILSRDIVKYLRVSSLRFTFVPLGMFSASAFNGMGKGLNALVLTLFRVIIIAFPFSYVFGVTLGFKLTGVWWGFVISSVLTGIIAMLWLQSYFKKPIMGKADA